MLRGRQGGVKRQTASRPGRYSRDRCSIVCSSARARAT
jgi:hypothetical protein